jgi:hypothetical protein
MQGSDELPPFLRITEPLTPEELPLQVALLTMELARMRLELSRLSDTCTRLEADAAQRSAATRSAG